MVYSWLRAYVLLAPVAAVVSLIGAIYFAVSGDSSSAKEWIGGSLGSALGYLVGRIALRAIENKRANEFEAVSE